MEKGMRELTVLEQPHVVAANSEPETPPPLDPPRSDIDVIMDQLRHLNDRPGTY
jgi:hypothetical protein